MAWVLAFGGGVSLPARASSRHVDGQVAPPPAADAGGLAPAHQPADETRPPALPRCVTEDVDDRPDSTDPALLAFSARRWEQLPAPRRPESNPLAPSLHQGSAGTPVERDLVVVGPEWLIAGDAAQLTATSCSGVQGVDARPKVWSSSDEAVAVVDADGRLTARRAGVVTVTVQIDETRTGSRAIVVLPHVAELEALTDSTLQGTVGVALRPSLAVTLRDAQGMPLRGVPVAWMPGQSGSVTPAVAFTDAMGVARAQWIPGPRAGVQTLTASAGNVAAQFTVRAAPGPAAALEIVGGDAQEGSIRKPLDESPSVRVRDTNGNPVRGVPVRFAVTSGSGSLRGPVAVTDSTGLASLGNWILGDTPGKHTIAARLPSGVSLSFRATAVARCTRLSVLSGDGGLQRVGSSRTVRVRIRDDAGGACAGVKVHWDPEAGGRVVARTSFSDASGIAETVWTAGTGIGLQSLRAYRLDRERTGAIFTLLAHADTLVDVVRDFGAVPDGRTDQEPVLQAALDSAAVHGGGIVYLPEGTYGLGNGLIVRSGVHVVGAGAGRTVLQPLVRLLGKLEEGAEVYSAVAMVGARNASVTHLTIDFSAAGTHANGVSVMPAGVGYSGSPTTDSQISGVEVIGGGNFHAYMIWNLLGRRIRILNNRVDGRVMQAAPSNQEGIESLGGKDVLILGNEVRNVGLNGIFLLSHFGEGQEQERVTVVENRVFDSGRGITVAQLEPYEFGPARDVRQVRVEHNLVEGFHHNGIRLQQYGAATVSGLSIRDNRIVARPGGRTTSIRLLGNRNVRSGPSYARDVVVAGNVILGSEAQYAIVAEAAPEVAISENRITRGGIGALLADRVRIVDNVIEDAPENGVRLWGQSRGARIGGNTIVRWARKLPAAAGVQLEDVLAGDVVDNRFGFDTPVKPTAVSVSPTSAGVVMLDNVLLDEWDGTPFVNNGVNSKLGSFVVPKGDIRLMVSAPLARPESRIAVRQTRGPSNRVAVTPGEGAFTVRFAVPATGEEEFRFAIDSPEETGSKSPVPAALTAKGSVVRSGPLPAPTPKRLD
jgi:hypothetical protein